MVMRRASNKTRVRGYDITCQHDGSVGVGECL